MLCETISGGVDQFLVLEFDPNTSSVLDVPLFRVFCSPALSEGTGRLANCCPSSAGAGVGCGLRVGAFKG